MKTLQKTVNKWSITTDKLVTRMVKMFSFGSIGISYNGSSNELTMFHDTTEVFKNIDSLHHSLNKQYSVYIEKEVLDAFMMAIGFSFLNRE